VISLKDHLEDQHAEGGKMATKKRTIKKQVKPKRITPNNRATPHLSYDRKDKALLVSHLREKFYKSFTRGFRLEFHDAGEILSFMPHHRLTPQSAQRNLKGLGVSPKLITMAVDAIESQGKEWFPRTNHVRFDLWFRHLGGESFGKKLKEIVAATPETLAKWDKRLKQCGRSWKDIGLSDEAIIHITKNLFGDVFGQQVTYDAIEKRFHRWEKNQEKIIHGYGGFQFAPRKTRF
jgi:hypothetical protein